MTSSSPSLENLSAVPLVGRTIRLEPLTFDHADELFEIGRDESIWQFMPDQPLTSLDRVRERIATELGRAIPFAIYMLECGSFAGCIEYSSIDAHNESVELGWMWVGRAFRGTLAAPEAMQLLAAHAFDAHGAGRVWLATDARNKASNVSLRSFGITFEACLRRHLRLADGFIRDTNIYAITVDEWPVLRKKWEALLESCSALGQERPDRRTSIARLFRDARDHRASESRPQGRGPRSIQEE